MTNRLRLFYSLVCALLSMFMASHALSSVGLTLEEQRVPQAYEAMPEIKEPNQETLNNFSQQLNSMRLFAELYEFLITQGNTLWQQEVKKEQATSEYEDRRLYWSRLEMLSRLKDSSAFQSLSVSEKEALIRAFEFASRGQQDIHFSKTSDFKVLVTGFDPFFLDRNIQQSNPSGVAALGFDNRILHVNEKRVELQSYILPVRFADFDQGVVEELMTPLMVNKEVDMVLTLSMGRDEFDLERFPGLRRSAEAPDNLNVFTGATSTNPLVPMLNGSSLDGSEFVEFSLPVEAMLKVNKPFGIQDNHKVTAMSGEILANSLKQLEGEISVQGSGGGYLSNEVSYRSLLLRDAYAPGLPVGHLHTPKVIGHDPNTLQAILTQVEEVLVSGVSSLM